MRQIRQFNKFDNRLLLPAGFKPMLDNGHGGVINGVYQTPGKRSPNWQFGVLYEGVWNRLVINGVIAYLQEANVPYYHLCPELQDIPIRERVRRANAIYAKDRQTHIYSQHANAGGGDGLEGFTSVGQTRSDIIAEYFLSLCEKRFKSEGVRFRYDTEKDGDKDKEKQFGILRLTNAPAFLMEGPFMDHPKGYRQLNDHQFLEDWVCFVGEFFTTVYRHGIWL